MKPGNLRHLVPGLLALALLHVPASEARVYCCKDARGQQVCGDVLPAACADRGYRELNSQGATVKQVEAPMTEAQRAKRDAEAKKARDEDMVRQEQRRRDTTLLNTYTSEREIDAARDRRIADIEELLARLREQQQTLSERQKKLEKDAAVFTAKSKRVPSGLKDRLDTNGEDLRQIGENIAQKERDLADTKKRFEEDRARFREIAGNR
ncbi:DUF4124 domain-containing protein [Methyloversatilis discipulorum]|jgi:hypothetical protein|uniref:DUF4124 domain-containing protein n=1 Tax=Methyloversatilis discipulorum TaxID=1119528 RepID=UPI001A5E83D1|nr:DUF4124 domain-containing protein [Methyloversatilis discipulorum]MBL8467766.1 DUF4124 domain-containing protein [Methyloversatilis discipulorum]MDY0056668.1 DUF4124 domain-containing protein [Methyloversatilis sp.]